MRRATESGLNRRAGARTAFHENRGSKTVSLRQTKENDVVKQIIVCDNEGCASEQEIGRTVSGIPEGWVAFEITPSSGAIGRTDVCPVCCKKLPSYLFVNRPTRRV